ncbi:hypothetical protein [Xanthomonas maliensis]|uniref:hypothetical protein n=1 Tax=Xanthomonas maliensis TaxID=1321368 RepID=UPI001264F2FA|nr:hypothetical protein [Xanthomonas maliensis]KAB7765818.1 hypothetical protein CKY51_14580 [Xanthomonas maliensis]
MIRKYLSVTFLLAVATFVAIVAAVLITKGSFFFHDAVLPFTDYASNDMLVVEAKHLALWHGNYSRVGFYHPGPFFFQLMAWSELLFFDLIPIFHSPFAAQVFASLSFAALAIALVVAFMHRLTGSVAEALLGASVFTVVLLLAKSYSFTAPWPPFLYVGASVVFVVGAAGLLLLGWRWLPWLILGAGGLIHGHASFVGLVPIICFVLVAGCVIAWRSGQWAMAPLNTLSKSTLLISALLIIALLAPLLAQTLVHWPGEFPKYFAFAGHREPNQIPAVVGYVFDFVPFWYLVLPLAIVVGWALRARVERRHVSVGALIFLAGLVAAMLYARKGIDSLEYRYLEYWFTPFYAILAALTVVSLVALWKQRRPAVGYALALSAVGVAVLLGAKSSELLQTPASMPVAVYQKALDVLTVKAGGKQVALTIDRQGGWDDSWADSATLLAYAKRVDPQHPGVCIDTGSWHILFHEENRCDEDGKHQFVLVSSKFLPQRKQIAATPQVRYYLAEGAGNLGNRTSPKVGDASLSTDVKLLPTETAVVMRLDGQPRLEHDSGLLVMRIVVSNVGLKPLAGHGAYPVNLAIVRLPGGKGGQRAMPRTELLRTPLPGIKPGSSTEMVLSVRASEFDNGAVVRLELLQEGAGWFTYDYGLPPLDLGPMQRCENAPLDLCETVAR